MPMRQEMLSWQDVDRLIDSLIPQFAHAFDAMLVVTRGGIIPGGLIAEALDLKYILTAAVNFPLSTREAGMSGITSLMAWPDFLQFPEAALLEDRRTLIVDDVWGSGRTITAVRSRVEAAGGYPELCVLHYNPHRNLFTKYAPTYYAAITDARIVYPWEIDRGVEGIWAGEPESN